MMTDWYQRAIDALQLNGLGERTQQAYVRALRILCELYHKGPNEISEPELQQYLGHTQLETTKVAISDHRILSFTEGRVRFSYQKSGSTRRRVIRRTDSSHLWRNPVS